MILKLLNVLAQLPALPQTPEIAEQYLPATADSFGKDLWYVVKQGLSQAAPNFAEAASVCSMLIALVLLLSILQNFTGITNQTVYLVGVLSVATLLLRTSGVLIDLGAQSVKEISQYGSLLVPVLSTALAAQGGGSSALALYTGTVVFNTILTRILSRIIIPAVYIYIAICIANRSVGNEMLSNIGKTIKWAITWILKIGLYIFTGYISITGVVSGAVDATTIKATKLAISGAVPVVGGILSDASEALLVGIGVAKNAAGIVGLLTILAIWIGPFLRIGIQFALLRLTSTVCSVFGDKAVTGIIEDFSTAMGFLLAATGSIGFIHLVSTVCFIRGVAS